MKYTRRALIVAAGVVVLTGGLLGGRRFPPGLAESELEKVFGWEIATHPESRRFMEDFLNEGIEWVLNFRASLNLHTDIYSSKTRRHFECGKDDAVWGKISPINNQVEKG